MKIYDNKRPYNGIEPKDGEQLVPVLAHELLEWDKECIERGLSKPGQLLKRDNLETWHYGGRKILVGFVAVPDEQVSAALEAFRTARNQYIEETRKKRCLIMNDKGDLVECPKHNQCWGCEKPGDWNFEMITSKNLSLDKMLDDLNNEEANGFDPTTIEGGSEVKILSGLLQDLLSCLNKENKEYAKIIQLTYEGYSKAEILQKINYPKGKSQGYEYIEKVFEFVRLIIKKR